MYTFTHIDTCVASVIEFIQDTELLKRVNMKPKVIAIAAKDKIFVQGLDRSKNLVNYAMPIRVTISAQTNDPMELFAPEEWGQFIWNVEIMISPKPKLEMDGNCFYMQVFIPAGNPEGVVVSWLNQIMIDPMSHAQITPDQCIAGKLPKYQWGTLFMNLYEAFTMEFASKIGMPMVGGLVDDAFVNYCHGPVNFSDFRRLTGSDPWYESFGFYLANIDEYRHALVNRYTNANAQASVVENYNNYKIQLNLCRESEPNMDERDYVCNNFGLACDRASSCPGGSCMLHNREMYSYVGDQIRANNPQACQWISNEPPLSSCMMAFNRHFNSQTIRIVDENNVINDYAVRLKFYKFYTVGDSDSYA